MRAMVNNSGVPLNLRKSLSTEYAMPVTKPCNTICKKGKFYGELPNYGKVLNAFGEIGRTPSRSNNITESFFNKGDYCIFLGHPQDHFSDTNRVMDLRTKTRITTRGVR